jgi:hypothetical protein
VKEISSIKTRQDLKRVEFEMYLELVKAYRDTGKTKAEAEMQALRISALPEERWISFADQPPDTSSKVTHQSAVRPPALPTALTQKANSLAPA